MAKKNTLVHRSWKKSYYVLFVVLVAFVLLASTILKNMKSRKEQVAQTIDTQSSDTLPTATPPITKTVFGSKVKVTDPQFGIYLEYPGDAKLEEEHDPRYIVIKKEIVPAGGGNDIDYSFSIGIIDTLSQVKTLDEYINRWGASIIDAHKGKCNQDASFSNFTKSSLNGKPAYISTVSNCYSSNQIIYKVEVDGSVFDVLLLAKGLDKEKNMQNAKEILHSLKFLSSSN